MQSRVESERLLKIQAVKTCGLKRVKNQIPAMSGYCARNRHKAMTTKKVVTKGLLARARNPGTQPIGIRHNIAFDDMNVRNIGNQIGRAHV